MKLLTHPDNLKYLNEYGNVNINTDYHGIYRHLFDANFNGIPIIVDSHI